MKRDMDLIRKLVLSIEDSPSGFVQNSYVPIEGYSRDQIGYHQYLILDAGFACGENMTGMGDANPSAILTNLTWQGHEFASAVRDHSRWKQAVATVQEKAGTVTIDVLKSLLTALMKSSLGLP
jgi:hypothetical protein